MSKDNMKTGRQREPYDPWSPERRWPWPSPTPGVPMPDRREQGRILRQILEKLEDIERRLDKIEKMLSGKP